MANKLIAIQYMSLDGVIQDPVGMENSGLGDWTGPFKRGPEGDQFQLAALKRAHAVILGRVTYDGFAAVWPQVNDSAGYAAHMNRLPKHVPSRTLKRLEWNNSHRMSGDLAEATRAVKANAQGDIVLYGSASLVHQLMPHKLIDEYALMVFPVVLGRGTRLFPPDVRATLSLIEHQQFGDGITLLRYAHA
jgi:dihydrofolate reductase